MKSSKTPDLKSYNYSAANVPAPIESLRNLGPKSSRWLREAGISTIAELRRLGSVAAFPLVKQRQPKAGLNLLWALAAGLKGIDWRKLTEETRTQLRTEAEE
jgi:DNA transformation protein